MVVLTTRSQAALLPAARPRQVRSQPVRSAARALMVGAEGLRILLPLLRRQLGPDRQQKAGIRLFKLGPRLRNLIDA